MRRSLAPSQSSICKKVKSNDNVQNLRKDICSPQIITSSSGVRSVLDVINLVENVDILHESEVNADNDDVDIQKINKLNASSQEIHHVTYKKEPNLSVTDEEKTESYFKVVWCKRSTRKHKKWEGDAVLAVRQRSVVLKSLEGKEIGRAIGYKQSDLSNLEDGSELVVGGKEIKITEIISHEDYKSGSCFLSENGDVLQPTKQSNVKAIRPFRNPSKDLSSSSTGKMSSTPMYDPSRPGAFVLPRPTLVRQYQNSEQNQTIVDVVVDPSLSSKLREHQKDGIIFLYECLTQIRVFNGQGAILADEMGLGKTLQCIALLWTMLKQGPFGGRSLVRRVLIITPSTLVKNWMKEFTLWLGKEKLRVCLASQTDKLEAYVKSQMEPVMITSYELAMRHHELLQRVKFDLMICDEGHRLKNSSTKTCQLLGSLPIKKRIALTGTPIQNDLQELFSLVDFINPGILGSAGCFKKVYEEPIVRSKQPDASKEEVNLGQARSQELGRLTGQFILRRTQDVIDKYLPSKTEYVVFCRPSELQSNLYNKILSSRLIKSCLAGLCKDSSFHLVCISCLKKLCNHPALLYQSAKDASEAPEMFEDSPYDGLLPIFPEEFKVSQTAEKSYSGKLLVLFSILREIQSLTPKEKVVIVSNSTKTLDILERMCKLDKYSLFRLDGSTPLNNRQDLVDRFNASYSDTFIFLLSSKAGGVGLNLVGASRLILFDIDWNPANDLQAMSRVWRDGQKKHVHIYRLLTTGSLEEKIFQRQITKQNLTTVLAKSSHKKMQFSLDELRDLFTFNTQSECATHDLMACDCYNDILPVVTSDDKQCNRPAQLTVGKTWNKSTNFSMNDLMLWTHVRSRCITEQLQVSCFS
ncbi:DNA repair and recombination protein rad54b, variant 2 [Chamberlinius hualienensis]